MSNALTHIENKPSLRATHCEDEGRRNLKQSHPLVPSLRFKEFGGEWEKHSLTSVYSKIVVGFVGTVSNHYCDENVGVQFIRTLNVKDGWFSSENFQFVTNKFHNKNKKSQVKNGDILIARVGANMGLVCEITGLEGEANSANVIIIKDDVDNSSSFYSLYLSSSGGQRQIQSKGAGGAQEVLNISVAKTINVPVPSLPEQQKIASFLSAVDEKIQQLTKKKALLEQYKKGLMHELFSGQLRFKDEKGKDYPHWEEKRLGDISTFLDGRRKPIKSGDRSKMQGEYPYYGASGIIDHVNNYIFDEEIILLGEDGENIISRNLPLAFRVSGKCWINNHAHVIKPNENTDIDFLTYSLERINYEPYNTGTAQPKLNQAVCRSLPLNLPSYPEQQKIATYLSGIDTKIESVNTQITQTQTFKKGLLQQMFV
jgi:type I restriction enzyme S subunit